MSFTVLRARALLIVHHFKDVSDCVHWWSLFLFQCQSLWPDWTRSQSNICLYISDGSFLQLSCSSHSPPSLTCRSHSHALHSAPAPPPSQLQTHGRERGVWTPEISTGTRSLGCRKIRVIMGKGKHESIFMF